MVRRGVMFGVCVGLMAALAQASYGDGFAGARDQDMTFHVVKGNRTYANVDSKAPAETIKGVAKDVTGEIKLNPAKLDKVEGKFSVPFKSLDIGRDGKPNKMMRDKMLAPEWIDGDKYPDAVFT